GTCSVIPAASCAATSVSGGPGSTCGGPGGTCPATTSACCNASTGVCTYVLGTDCAAGNNNRGASTVCSPNTCPQDGACCADAPRCAVIGFFACPGPSLYQGVGSPCAGLNGPCPASLGSCCGQSGACTYGRQVNCGAIWTIGGACTPNNCFAPPLGACC